ncbi:MAG: transposase [Candidatus Heimdallarchaeota archaeon]
MRIPLIVDETDPKWSLLGQILKGFDTRPTKQQLARQRMTPVSRAALMLRIVLIAMFFAQEISYVIEELTQRSTLRSFARIPEVPSPQQLYSFLGKFTVSQFLKLVSGVLNTFCTPRQRGRNTLIVDSTEITVDLNWFRKKYTKRALEARDYQWGFSPSKGHYIGYKLSLVVAYPSLKPLAFLLHPGSPSDSKLYDEILQELRRRRLTRNGDLVVFDKGYFSYKNYMKGVARYKIVPGAGDFSEEKHASREDPGPTRLSLGELRARQRRAGARALPGPKEGVEEVPGELGAVQRGSKPH